MCTGLEGEGAATQVNGCLHVLCIGIATERARRTKLGPRDLLAWQHFKLSSEEGSRAVADQVIRQVAMNAQENLRCSMIAEVVSGEESKGLKAAALQIFCGCGFM